MLSRILRTIRDHALLERGDRVLVAVSGGPDSTALLHALATLSHRLGVLVAAACVDHGLRLESAEEARVVVERCRSLGIRCETICVDVGQARRSHVSIQEAARVVRLAGLVEVAKQVDCNKIALGHTADDQAETVLFRIIRGTGLVGLAGIPYKRDSFVRPLLDVRRAELLAYLGKRKLPFFSDPSNANRRYARSRIRHDVLPMLGRENPRVVEALLALSREAQGHATDDWRRSLPDGLYLPRRAADSVERAVRAGGTQRIAVKDGEIVVRYGRAQFEKASDAMAQPCVDGLPAPVSPAGGCFRLFGPPAPALEILPEQRGPWPDGGNRACFDVSRLEWPLSVRAWQPGDRMAPRSGRGSRKLSDLLIDAKIPRRDRAALPVLCDGSGTILFVPGLRPSEAGRPGLDTRGWIEVRVAR